MLGGVPIWRALPPRTHAPRLPQGYSERASSLAALLFVEMTLRGRGKGWVVRSARSGCSFFQAARQFSGLQ